MSPHDVKISFNFNKMTKGDMALQCPPSEGAPPNETRHGAPIRAANWRLSIG